MFNNKAAETFETGSLFLGRDEKNRQIGVSTDRHAVTVAGARSGKGAALIIPNLLRWPHNALVIDPKGENAEATFEQREKMGQAIHVLDPFGSANVPDRVRAFFNPLTAVDTTSNRARATISAIANGLVVVHDPKHMEWTSGARSLLAGIIAYVLVDAPPEHHNFATVRQILMQPSGLPDDENGQPQGLYADAQIMAQDTRMGGLIRSAGITLMTAIETDKGMEKDFLGLARRATEWLDDDAISACLSSSTFQLSDLKTGNASVYLVLPADGDFLQTYGAFLRLFVKSALTAMGVGQDGKRCLFILDEFFSLGKLEEISEAAGRMPSYGVHLWPFLQDLGQAHQLYGESGTETFFGNSDAQIFFGNTDPKTLEYASKMIGNLRPEDLASAPPERDFVNPYYADAYAIESFEFERKMRDHQHRMSAVGSPRVPPEKLRELVSKPPNGKVANSMVVFARGGQIYNLQLQPYFETAEPFDPNKAQGDYWPQEAKIYAVYERYGLPEKSWHATKALSEWNFIHRPNSNAVRQGRIWVAEYNCITQIEANKLHTMNGMERWLGRYRTFEEFVNARNAWLSADASANDPMPTIKRKG